MERMTALELAEVLKSPETAAASSVHHPLGRGRGGLWHTPSKKVPRKEQLPAYFQNTARAIARRDGGDPEDKIGEAISAVQEWATGTAFGGRVKVTDEVREAAAGAIAEWEALRVEHAD
jgi:hypothetical protein